MPLVSLGLTKGQTRSKSPQNNIFMVLYRTWAPRRFLATLTKFDLESILGGSKNTNFDLDARMDWNQCHREDNQILIPTIIHVLK